MDRIWGRECGNGREGEAGVWCTNVFGGLVGSLGDTVLLAADCRVFCWEKVIFY